MTMFPSLGPWEILLVLFVVLLFFGAKRLPEIGSALGKGIREFKRSVSQIEAELQVPPEEPRRSAQVPSSAAAGSVGPGSAARPSEGEESKKSET